MDNIAQQLTAGPNRWWRLCSSCSWVVSFMLLLSAVGHMLSPYLFLGSIAGYQISMTEWQMRIVSIVFPMVQFGVGASILTWPRNKPFVFAAFLGTLFLVLQIQAIVRNIDINCGCFNGYDSRIGIGSISVAVLLIVASVGGMLSERALSNS